MKIKTHRLPASCSGAKSSALINLKFALHRLLGTGTAFFLLVLCPGMAHASFNWVNLVSDIHGVALNTDSDLVNPWGLVPGPFDNIWVADNGTGVLTRYDDSSGQPLNTGSTAIPIPPSIENLIVNGTDALSAPTGLALNHQGIQNSGTAGGFVNPLTETPAWFVIASEDGAISVYTPALAGNGKKQSVVVTGSAAIVIDNSTVVTSGSLIGAVYKGIAIATSGSNTRQLYATNFRSGNVEVYDKNFQFVKTFTDSTATAAGYAPFNIQRIDVAGAGQAVTQFLFVTFALQDDNKHDDISGPGNGLVDVFDTDGNLKLHFSNTGGDLNSPWGMAYAPGVFGTIRGVDNKLVLIKNTLLVGNFGDGKIHAFDMSSLLSNIVAGPNHPVTELGALTDSLGRPLQFDGLWALHFGRHGATVGAFGVDSNIFEHNLFFSAGIVDENDGLMGKINFLNASH